MKTLRESYDVAVIGAGPAGLNAALHLLSAPGKPSVVILDKQVPWEKPIACAEAVGKLGLHSAVDVDPSWIRFLVSKAEFHAPGGSTVCYTDPNKGYIINRAKMQRDLFDKCAAQGADADFRRVTAVGAPVGSHRAVTLADGGSLSARVVIDASGPISFLGKSEKIAWKGLDLEPAYFAVVAGLDYPTDTVHIFVGQSIAPGGYAWVFPRDKGTFNVGVLVGTAFRGTVNIKRLLDAFITTHYPHAEAVQRFAGTIPCGYVRRPIATRGLLKTGDAASTINPASRAGIVEALLSGGLAGDFAVKMLEARSADHMTKICRGYEKAWYELRGKRHLKLAKVKESLRKVPDADYDKAASTLSSIPHEELKMSKIFQISLGRFPRLVWAMRHLM